MQPLRAPFIRLWVAALCGYLALGATLQVLPTFAVQHFSAGPATVGALIGLSSLAAAVARIVAGRAADRGSSRRVVWIGGLLGSIGGLAHAWAPDLATLYVARLLLGAGEGALFTGAIAWVLQTCATERRGTLAGWFGLSMWAGLSVGPAMAAWIQACTGRTDAIWLLVFSLPLLASVLVWSTAAPSKEVRAAATHTAPTPLLPPGAGLPGLAFGASSYGYGAINALLILYLGHAGLGGEGIALSVFAFAFLITRAAGSQLVNRYGGQSVLLVTIAIEMLGLGLIPSNSLGVALTGTILAGIGVAMLFPAFVGIAVQRVAATQQGAAVGVMASSFDLGLLLAGPLSGAIATVAGYPMAFGFAVLLALASWLIVWRLRQPARPDPRPETV